MKIINPDVKELVQEQGLEGIYKQIALAGRICYASDKIDGNKEFVERLIKMGHGRPLEFGTVYLKIKLPIDDGDFAENVGVLIDNHWTKYKQLNNYLYITTNYRVIVENCLENLLTYICEPTEHHYKRRTILCTISRAVADEARTHTALSSLMQSTRYCAYDKDKFGNEITVCKPHWVHSNDYHAFDERERIWFKGIENAEINYLKLRELGVLAEDARGVLPLDIKTEFIQCGFEEDWYHFINLRFRGTTGAPHPDIKIVASKINDLLCL